MELERASRHKLENKIAQKRGVITIGKTQEKIANRKANKLTIAQCALIKVKKTAHNVIVGPWLLIFKEGSKMKNIFK